MKYSKLFESLDSRKVNMRRYSLSEIISESYNLYYNCPANTNLQKVAESHINDVRKNPSDIERLSRQLCKLKYIKRMVESKKMKDEELLVPEESYDTVEPKEKKIEESALAYTWGDFQHEKYGSPCRVKFYTKGQDMTNQIIGCVYEPDGKEYEDYGAEIYDNSIADVVEFYPEGFDSEEEATAWVENWFSKNLEETKRSKFYTRAKMEESSYDEEVTEREDEDLLEDTELTDEEVEELTKHLEEIRKNKKVSECDEPKKEEVKENRVGRKLKRKMTESTDKFVFNVDFEDGNSMPFDDEKDAINYAKKKRAKSVAKTPIRVTSNGTEDMDGDNEEIIWTPKKESKSWSDLQEGMKNFSSASSTKAFYKTFKKMYEALKEGKALTRQESINLYKAVNSAMTHFSVELEHNPGFIDTFKECTSLLSVDANRLLESMKNGKAPSKATMKSLAKFVESLLREDKEEDKMTPDEMKDYWEKNKSKDPVLANYKSYDEWYKDSKSNGYVKDEEDIDEAAGDEEEELPPIEDEEIPDEEHPAEEGAPEEEETSDEVDEFDQEYADARYELHKEIADEHAGDEDPEIQEKIEQDAVEVSNLPGLSDEQLADLANEQAQKDGESEESPAEDPEEDVEEAKEEEITDDELAELKKHLTEMRKARNSK